MTKRCFYKLGNGVYHRSWFTAVPVLCILSVSLPLSAQADLFHYSNLLIGPRAMGLGGAFTAMSDDPSGLYYNPAGLAFQNSPNLSSSINTFYLRQNSYEKVFGDDSFEDSARGTVSSFFGFSRQFKPPLLGPLQLGLAFVNPDAALSNENTLIENKTDADVVRYHRSANIRSGSSQVIVGFAKRLGKDTGVGCAASYLDIDELEQIYQDVVQGPFRFDALPETDVFSTLGQNVRMHLIIRGAALRCGMRTHFGNSVRIGFSYQHAQPVYQRLEYDIETNKVFNTAEGSIVAVESSATDALQGQLLRSISRSTLDHFVNSLPTEIRLGFAYQPVQSFLISGDLVRHGLGEGSVAQVKRAEVINASLGTEVTLANALVIRSGVFTNQDATSSRNLSSASQRGEYIDYLGASFAAGIKIKSGEYTLQYTEQRGRGRAEKVTGNPQPSSSRLQVISISANQFFQ